MEARRAWEGVEKALKDIVGEQGVVGPTELGDALARNGVLVSTADSKSVWEAIIGEGTVTETVSKLKPTPRAGKGSIEEWGERFQTPAFISGMIGNDIFSGVQQTRERKHFGETHNVAGKDTITKDVLGGDGPREESRWDGGDGGVTESAPYYLEGQQFVPPPLQDGTSTPAPTASINGRAGGAVAVATPQPVVAAHSGPPMRCRLSSEENSAGGRRTPRAPRAFYYERLRGE